MASTIAQTTIDVAVKWWDDYLKRKTSEKYRVNFCALLRQEFKERDRVMLDRDYNYESRFFRLINAALEGTEEERKATGMSPFNVPTKWYFVADITNGFILAGGETILENGMPPGPSKKEFENLLREYNSSVRYNRGCGEDGQIKVDEKYNELIKFVELYPEFKDKLPAKAKCGDNMHVGAAQAIIDGGDCCIQ